MEVGGPATFQWKFEEYPDEQRAGPNPKVNPKPSQNPSTDFKPEPTPNPNLTSNPKPSPSTGHLPRPALATNDDNTFPSSQAGELKSIASNHRPTTRSMGNGHSTKTKPRRSQLRWNLRSQSTPKPDPDSKPKRKPVKPRPKRTRKPKYPVEKVVTSMEQRVPSGGCRVSYQLKFVGSDLWDEWYLPEDIECDDLIREFHRREPNALLDAIGRAIIQSGE